VVHARHVVQKLIFRLQMLRRSPWLSTLTRRYPQALSWTLTLSGVLLSIPTSPASSTQTTRWDASPEKLQLQRSQTDVSGPSLCPSYS
jgi:hypothetical protein